jgi:hypothetical protein
MDEILNRLIQHSALVLHGRSIQRQKTRVLDKGKVVEYPYSSGTVPRQRFGARRPQHLFHSVALHLITEKGRQEERHSVLQRAAESLGLDHILVYKILLLGM